MSETKNLEKILRELEYLNTSILTKLENLEQKGIIKDLELVEWVKKCEELGAGELLLTSVDNDGCECGYDEELISFISKEVKIPIIANGGASIPSDAIKAIEAGADAIAAASIFHFTQYTPNNIKEALREVGISVRL